MMTNSAPSAVVRAVGLNLSFGDVQPLRNVSFEVPAGAVVGIVGRNGAGKTTLLNALLGLTIPDAGVAELLGEPSRALTDAAKSKLGYVAQTPELFEWMKVRDQLDLYAALYPTWSRTRAGALITRFQLNLKARTQSLSLGERQRLAIVLALAHSPELLILDEPVASLDPMSRRDFLRTLFETDDTAKSRTVLLSSHLLEDLERVVSHVLFMRNGAVQLFATMDEIEAHIRVFESATSQASTRGLLHESKSRDGGWRAVIDTRALDHTSALATQEGRALSVSELFIALNQS